MFIVSILLSIVIFFLSTKSTHAIIVIVPVVLVPIVSIVVWIIGAITAPVVALSTLYFKAKKRSPIIGFLIGTVILIMLGIVITIMFKLLNPERPIY